MKKIVLLYFLIIGFQNINAQATYDYKRDYTWILGYANNCFVNFDCASNIYLDFKGDSMILYGKPFVAQSLHQTNASICDTAGNLLFYSNGCVIVDSSHQFFEGVDTINLGPKWESYCHYSSIPFTDGYNVVNGCWIIPVGRERYKVLYGDGLNSNTHATGIRYTTVVQKEEGLIGYDVDKYMFEADLNTSKNGMVRHANGRDWWRVDEARDEELYYITYIDHTDSIYETKVQEFVVSGIDTKFTGGGQGVFSPDGTLFATFDQRNGCQVFDFDRCKGELSNLRILGQPLPYDSIYASTGIGISPNSRFMYLSCGLSLWQYDLWASDIEASKIRVANTDFSIPTWQPMSFYQQQLGPDGKLYVFTPGSREALTVVEYPDSLGLACKVVQAKHWFDQWGDIAQPPRFPNYRLGPEVGSPCDTITDWSEPMDSTSTIQVLDNQIHERMQIRPNPATDNFVVDITLRDYSAKMALKIEVMDATGRLVRSVSVPPYAALQRVEVGDLANGLYFVRLISSPPSGDLGGFGRILAVEKLVVSHP